MSRIVISLVICRILQRSLQQDGIRTSIGPMNILRRPVGVNLVLPRYHKRYSCASV
jgi:hypothetical protein